MDKEFSYSDKPWIQSYKVGPFKLPKTMKPYPKIPVHKFLDDSTQEFPDNVACTYLGKDYIEELTYSELKLRVDKLATALYHLGVKKGDKVATILPSCPQFIIADYAIMKIGAIHVPLSILHKTPEVLYEIKESDTKVVICSYRRLDRIYEIKDEINLTAVIYTIIPIFPDYVKPEIKELPNIKNLYHLDKLLEEYEPNPPTVEIDPQDDIALLPFTGGTTGVPKATMLTHYALVVNVIQSVQWMMHPLRTGIKGKAAIEIMVPIFHQMGHWMVHAGIAWGLRLLLIDARDLTTIVDGIKKYRPFMVGGVPTHYMLLADFDIPKMPVFFFSGAAALPQDVAENWEKKVGVPLGEGYGCTEATACTHLNLSGLSKVTGFMPKVKRAIGIPIADTEVKLIDPDSGNEVPFGESGEIWVRGPQLMKGYWPIPGKGLTEDGWLATGDIGKMDKDGYFQVIDRIKDMINVSGMKVYSQTVDDVLHKHPAVSIAGVIGIPDPDRPSSERVKAFISLRDEYKGKITEEEIIQHCRDNLPPYAVPKFVEFRESLPLTIVMKLDKKKLKDEVLE